MAKVYSIFGAGPAGLYTAWRLLVSGKLLKGDTLELYDWGKYDFSTKDSKTRAPAGRICTYHYKNDSTQSYIEVGGMRYMDWDGNQDSPGHRLVTTVINQLGLDSDTQEFITTDNPLFYLRQKNFYSKEITASNPAPYYANHDLATKTPDEAFNYVARKIINNEHTPKTRSQQCEYYKNGKLPDSFKSQVYKPGNSLANIGYWNLMFDQLCNEGYQYAADGGGYSSNVINWNSADALIYNNEFVPGGKFKTLKDGYSTLFVKLFEKIIDCCKKKEISWKYVPECRLRSIYLKDGQIIFTTALRQSPHTIDHTSTTDYAFLAMPRQSLELVAQGTRYKDSKITDVLNHEKVQLYLQSVAKQPSYKIAMFFESEWWKDSKYSPKLGNNVFGPTITDTPLRQIYYFGNNGSEKNSPVYGMLASYDDENFTQFWQELELDQKSSRTIPLSEDLQPLDSPRSAPQAMIKMLRSQLACVHYGAGADLSKVPKPLETVFMDWSSNPFGAGYHAWAAHYDICDVMEKIRKPTQLIDGLDANIFIVGSAYSNDQAWVEGAFCTAESVLKDFLGVKPIIDESNYPFICRCSTKTE